LRFAAHTELIRLTHASHAIKHSTSITPMHEGLSQRLARQFRQKIETGEWAVGKRLPTTRALAAELGVSINTIQNAFRQLEAHNLVERRPRLGGFVKAKPSRGRGASSGSGGAPP